MSTPKPRWWNPLTTAFLDRATTQRLDENWLQERLADARTQFVPVWRSRHLIMPTPPATPIYLRPDDDRDLDGAIVAAIFLGVKAECTYVALDLDAHNEDIPNRFAGRGNFAGLREISHDLNEIDLALLAYARSMVDWRAQTQFCGACGHPTRSTAGGHVLLCTNPACGLQHFPRTDPAIIVLVTRGDRCLLGRQATWPPGRHSTIAGFVEPVENLEDAVAREVREETGIEVADIHYQGSQPWPFPRSLMLGFRATAATAAITTGDNELESARWFTRQEIKTELLNGALTLPSRISISRRLIAEWFDEGDLESLADLEAMAARV